MLTLALWLALMNHDGIHWTGDDVRTALIGMITGMGGLGLRLLWTMRDDVRDMKREVPEIKHLVELHEKEIRWLTGKRIAQEAIEQAERDSHQGPERRRHLRRDRDIVNEALMRDEPPYPEG